MIFECSHSDFANVEQDELVEVMDLHNYQRVSTSDNIEQLLEELATKS